MAGTHIKCHHGIIFVALRAPLFSEALSWVHGTIPVRRAFNSDYGLGRTNREPLPWLAPSQRGNAPKHKGMMLLAHVRPGFALRS